MWSFINLGIMFPAGLRQSRRGAIFLLFSFSQYIIYPHTHTRTISRCHSAVMSILARSISDTGKSPLQTLSLFFCHFPSPKGTNGEECAQLVSGRAWPIWRSYTRVYVCGSDEFRSFFQIYLCKNVFLSTDVFKLLFVSLSLSDLKLKFS